MEFLTAKLPPFSILNMEGTRIRPTLTDHEAVLSSGTCV